MASAHALVPNFVPNGDARRGRGEHQIAWRASDRRSRGRADNLRAIIGDMRDRGIVSIRRIADDLNARAMGTPPVPLGFWSG
jgi:hypothetical protein